MENIHLNPAKKMPELKNVSYFKYNRESNTLKVLQADYPILELNTKTNEIEINPLDNIDPRRKEEYKLDIYKETVSTENGITVCLGNTLATALQDGAVFSIRKKEKNAYGHYLHNSTLQVLIFCFINNLFGDPRSRYNGHKVKDLIKKEEFKLFLSDLGNTELKYIFCLDTPKQIVNFYRYCRNSEYIISTEQETTFHRDDFKYVKKEELLNMGYPKKAAENIVKRECCFADIKNFEDLYDYISDFTIGLYFTHESFLQNPSYYGIKKSGVASKRQVNNELYNFIEPNDRNHQNEILVNFMKEYIDKFQAEKLTPQKCDSNNYYPYNQLLKKIYDLFGKPLSDFGTTLTIDKDLFTQEADVYTTKAKLKFKPERVRRLEFLFVLWIKGYITIEDVDFGRIKIKFKFSPEEIMENFKEADAIVEYENLKINAVKKKAFYKGKEISNGKIFPKDLEVMKYIMNNKNQLPIDAIKIYNHCEKDNKKEYNAKVSQWSNDRLKAINKFIGMTSENNVYKNDGYVFFRDNKMVYIKFQPATETSEKNKSKPSKKHATR